VAQGEAGPAHGGDQREVLGRSERGQAADLAVGPRGDRQAGPGVVVVAGPGVARVGVEPARQLVDQPAIQDVAEVRAARPGAEGQPARPVGPDVAADGVGPPVDRPPGLEQPGRADPGVAVGRGDHPPRLPRAEQAAACLVHQPLPRRADVGHFGGELGLGHLERQSRGRGREPSGDRGRVVPAVVGQDDHLEARPGQGAADAVDLPGEGPEGRPERLGLVARRDDRDRPAVGVHGDADPGHDRPARSCVVHRSVRALRRRNRLAIGPGRRTSRGVKLMANRMPNLAGLSGHADRSRNVRHVGCGFRPAHTSTPTP